MSDILIIGAAAAAFVLGAVLTPLTAMVATAYGIVSPPRADRWSSRPIPLLGGGALLVATLAPILTLVPLRADWVIIALGAVAAFVLGLVDDTRGLRPTSKLVGQVVIGSGLALAGVRVELFPFPPLAFLLTIFWVVVLMNAVNLVDNMDGLAGGTTAIAAAVLVVMAPADPLWMRLLAAGLTGACIGFLVHNFVPARVYMGDAGSMLLGFLLAALSLQLTNVAASNVGLAILGPLLVLGLPIYDTTLVTLIRRAEGRPVSQGGRDHTSHRLAAMGLSERTTVLVLYCVAAGFALLGLLSSALGFAFVPLLILVVVGLILFGTFLAEAPSSVDGELARSREKVYGVGRRLLRFGAEIGLDLTLATTALLIAFLVRFEAISVADWMPLFVQAAPIVVPIQLVALVVFGVYRTLWRFVGVGDVMMIFGATVMATLAAGVIMLYPLQLTGQSRAVLIIDAVLVVALVGGSRFFLRWLRDHIGLRSRAGGRRVLIVGANETGQFALRLMMRSRDVAYEAVGFLDDDPGKQWRRIGAVPVVGRLADLGRVVERVRPDLIVIALEDDEVDRGELRERCLRTGVELREFSRAL